MICLKKDKNGNLYFVFYRCASAYFSFPFDIPFLLSISAIYLTIFFTKYIQTVFFHKSRKNFSVLKGIHAVVSSKHGFDMTLQQSLADTTKITCSRFYPSLDTKGQFNCAIQSYGSRNWIACTPSRYMTCFSMFPIFIR